VLCLSAEILESLTNAKQLAKGYADLAALCVQKADYAQAETLYQRALDMRAQTLGSTHPDYAQAC